MHFPQTPGSCLCTVAQTQNGWDIQASLHSVAFPAPSVCTCPPLTAQLFAMNIHEITGHPDRDLEILKCRASSALWWTEKSFTVHT